jgi:hypothetical protein
MSVLELVPQNWASWRFSVLEDGKSVAEIDMSRWREKGAFVVGGTGYNAYREGVVSGAFILELDGARVATAEKPNAMARRFSVEHAGRSYTWQGQVLKRSFVLEENDRAIGSLIPEGILTRKATAEFPYDLPLAVRVFMIWLALIMWKRQADS